MPSSSRFLFIDGLRGLAAMMVVVYHFRITVSEVSQPWIWTWLSDVIRRGYLGVDVFFVISGFVISYSVRNYQHTVGFLLRFGIRRSIRLDPPYWATIVLQLIAIKLGWLLFPALMNGEFPSWPKVAAHFAYLQDLLGYGNIVGIFWTLCYEVQFYIVFVGALVVAERLCPFPGAARKAMFYGIGLVTFVWSLLIFFGPLSNPLPGLFLDRWYQFFLGVLAMQSVTSRRVQPEFVAATLLVLIGSATNVNFAAHGVMACAVAVLVVVAGLRGKMHVWLASRFMLFLGLISYSLYLIHTVVGERFIKLLRVVVGQDLSPGLAWAALIVTCLVSILCAWTMYKLIEAPALRLCHRIRLDRPLDWGALKVKADV